MKRLHVHVSVRNLTESIRFYSGLTMGDIPVYDTSRDGNADGKACCAPESP